MPRTRKFLVVEDNLAVARTVARALRPRPSAIATSVREAITFLKDKGIGPLILDVNLPDGSGFEVLDHARSHGPFVDALVMSGDVSFVNHAFETNVQFIRKPVESQLIVAFANRVEERAHTRRTRILTVLDRWTSSYPLTPSERELLHVTALDGVSRKDLARRLGKSEETIKTQVHKLIAKTGHSSLLDAVVALLQAAV